MAFIALFREATLDNVTELMYTTMYGCDISGDVYYYSNQPGQAGCTTIQKQWALTVTYHVMFVVLSSQVLLTLFIGVVTTSMEEAKVWYNTHV